MIDKKAFNLLLLNVLNEKSNRKGIKKYYQNKELLDNVLNEDNLSPVERFDCYCKTKKLIIANNLRGCVL
jgi:hypothetical protein